MWMKSRKMSEICCPEKFKAVVVLLSSREDGEERRFGTRRSRAIYLVEFSLLVLSRS